jgi:hypothetical protein
MSRPRTYQFERTLAEDKKVAKELSDEKEGILSKQNEFNEFFDLIEREFDKIDSQLRTLEVNIVSFFLTQTDLQSNSDFFITFASYDKFRSV